MANIIPTELLAQWKKLQLRERMVIVGGAAIIVLAGLIFIFNHFMQVKNELRLQQQEFVEKFSWLSGQADFVASFGDDCASTSYAIGSYANIEAREELLQNLASIHQLALVSLDNRNDTYQLLLNSNNGNNILRFAHESACMGFELISVTVANVGEETKYYEGQLELIFL